MVFSHSFRNNYGYRAIYFSKSPKCPAQIIENNLKGAVGKANLKLYKMIMMGFFAGMFIAIGAEGSNLAVHTVDNFGLAKTLAGCIFPVGLMMLSIIGAELFTGNCMMITAVIDGRIKLVQMLKNWVIVYLSNMLGSVVTAALIYGSGQFDNSAGGLGAYTIKVAMGKTGLDFCNAFMSGIMCNVFAGAFQLSLGSLFRFRGLVLFVFGHCPLPLHCKQTHVVFKIPQEPVHHQRKRNQQQRQPQIHLKRHHNEHDVQLRHQTRHDPHGRI